MPIAYLLAAGASFLFLAVLFWPLEKLFPAKRQKLVRPEWWTDLLFFLGQYLVWGGLVLWILKYVAAGTHWLVPVGVREAVAGQALWLQIVEVVVLSDFLVYWGHRLQHRVPLLWRFHSIHHSAEHLDWLAAHREHPLDSVYTLTILNLPAFVLGFPLELLTGFLVFRGLWAIFIHSNVVLPLGPLGMLIGAPRLHHWHHDRSRDAGNYANLSPLMDLAFGTYRCPDTEPEELGISEPISRTYIGQMLHPFRRRPSPVPDPAGDLPRSQGEDLREVELGK